MGSNSVHSPRDVRFGPRGGAPCFYENKHVIILSARKHELFVSAGI